MSASVSGPVLMSSHSREQRGDTLDNRRPTFSLCSIPMSTELSHAQHCNVHIFFLYIMEVRVKVSVQTRFTFNIHVIDPHAWSSFCHFAHLYYEYIRFKFRGHQHCVAMVTNSHGTLAGINRDCKREMFLLKLMIKESGGSFYPVPCSLIKLH